MDTRYIPLTVTSRYAKSWGTWEGIRELVQNWHDGLHSMAAMLDDLPLDTSVTVELRSNKDKRHQTFEAFIRNPQTNEETVLGKLTYNWIESRLVLTNQCTALQKKILLLGYSVKADTKEVIGQFGEGLKIGALALVRQGHLVTIETGSDIWEFQLLHNEEFGEKVLTVVVSERIHDIDNTNADTCRDSTSVNTDISSSNSTCTMISGVEWEDWKKFLPRFLFLNPPKKYVKTELGTLLLDKNHGGQLYMKGIWVSNLQEEDLATGVDFLHLQIDRDRNAVPKPSEIDHQVSGMWIRALDKDPSLAQEYFYLLLNDKNRDVRHAADYATVDMATLVADQFLKEYGEDAFPVFNKTDVADIQAVKDELHRTAVLCNDTLVQLLVKSGRFDTLSTALTKHRKSDSIIVPYASLSPDQRAVLQEATALVATADSKFGLGDVDVIDTATREACTLKDHHVNVPLWMMNLDSVHQEMNLDFSQLKKHTNCKCRESVICASILETRASLVKPAKVNLVSPDSQHGPAFTFRPVITVVSSLATQVCGKAIEAYCADIHKRSTGSFSEDMMSDFRLKEEAYINTIARLEKQLEKSTTESIESLRQMEKKLVSVEKQLVQKEVDLVNEETLIQNKFEQQIKAIRLSAEESVKGLQTQVQSLEQKILNLQQQLHHKERKIQELGTEVDEITYSLEKKNNVLLEELSHYITQNRNRTVSLSRLSKEERDNTDLDTKEKWTLISNICDMVLEDLQSEKFICAVCKIKRKSRLLRPCGHYMLCEDCAESAVNGNRLCPVCKQITDSHIQVFE